MLVRFLRLLAIAVLIGVAALLFIDLERWIGNIPAELHAFAHVAFFGLLALRLMALPRLHDQPIPLRAAQVLLVVLMIGIMIELIQPLFGRPAGLLDIRQNLVGAAAAVSLYAAAGKTSGRCSRASSPCCWSWNWPDRESSFGTAR